MRERAPGLVAAISLLVAGSACDGDNTPEAIPDYARESARELSDCMRTSGSFDPTPRSSPFREVTPVPYPTPRGERVEPEFDVPAFPGSREIDGFEKDGWTTQVFEAEATEEELFDFYEDVLFDRHMVMTGIGHGPAGRRCTFVPYWERSGPRPGPVVVISTEWTPPGEREPGTPPPGYQGKGVQFAPPAPGVLWYFVTTRD
ncbi:MAG: hypothetical protein ACRDHF_11455 [Tepidiformaceae bacterium]